MSAADAANHQRFHYCILFAWELGLLAHFSRQPLILAYLIAGFFIGPFGMGWVKSQESISVISELGLIFMLFMIGLEIDLKKIVRAGRPPSCCSARSAWWISIRW
jgi:Kef-type K+ transport system membrane component KefB